MSFFHNLFELVEDDGPHTLLEPPTPAYSNLTIRRAFIVWMYCGQQNEFREVCNYYHHLEAMENKLRADERARSRHFEMDMFSKQPPSSTYLRSNFPSLYSTQYVKPQEDQVEEPTPTEHCVFNLAGFNEMSNQQGTTADEIVKASQMIRQYCRSHYRSLKIFLLEFKEYAKKCELNNTVNNVAFYLKRKMIAEELEMVKKRKKTFKVFSNNNHVDVFDNCNNNKTDRLNENNIEQNNDREDKETVKPKTILKRPDKPNNQSDILKDIIPNLEEIEIGIDSKAHGVDLKEKVANNMENESESMCVFGILAKAISLECLMQSEDEECVKTKYQNQGFTQAHIQRTNMASIRKI